jgi:hypothetical protein
MEFNKLVFGSIALGSLVAAGAAGYWAARQSDTPRPEAALAAPAEAGMPGAVDASRAVAESEGVIAPEPGAPPAPTAPTAATPHAVETPRRESSPRPLRPERVEGSRPAPAPSPVSVAPAARARAETPTPNNEPASSGGTMWEARPSMEPERPRVWAEPEPPPPPPAPEFVELVIPSDAVLGLQIDRTVSSDLARVEDRVDARVTRDVRVGDRVAIPAGSVVQGSVMEVERGGKVKERAKLGIRFHTVVLADGSRLNIKTDSIVREGPSPAKESAAKIGGAAAGGAILGAILGGGKGAAIGGSIGAAGGTAATMAGDREPAVLPAGTTVSVRVQQPVTVTVEK